MTVEKKKKKKRKLRVKGVILILLFLYLIGMCIYYFFTMHVKNIVILNNKYVTEKEIVEVLDLSENTMLFKTNTFAMKKKLKNEIPLINDVKIRKNLFGKITIDVKENKVLFYNALDGVLVLSDKTEISDTKDYIGYPVLVNYVPSEIYENLIKGFAKIDDDILYMISEIEYSPDKYNDVVIDDERFVLRMNDSNEVYINIVNIEKLNKYQTIYSTVGGDGILYLDSSRETYIFDTKNEKEQPAEENKENKENTNEN